MEPVPKLHLSMYNDPQKRVLQTLFNTFQNNHPIFVCDKSPIGRHYEKACDYPKYEGGSNYFSLAAEKHKTYWISWFNHVKVIFTGTVKWYFNNKDTLDAIVIIFQHNRKPAESMDDLIRAINTAFPGTRVQLFSSVDDKTS